MSYCILDTGNGGILARFKTEAEARRAAAAYRDEFEEDWALVRFGGAPADMEVLDQWDSPDPSWTERDGYVVAPLVNRGTLDAD